LHLKPFIQGLNGIIPGGISITDYSMVAETDQATAKKILQELIKIYSILIQVIDSNQHF